MLSVFVVASIALLSAEAAYSTDCDPISGNPSDNRWSWIAGGSFDTTYAGVYDNVPQADYLNSLSDSGLPAARDSHAGGFHDGIGLLYVFAGIFYDQSGDYNFLNDLWVYNTSSDQWGWVYGAAPSQGNQKPVYSCDSSCTLGPGSRSTHAFETSDGFVVYGQNGVDANGNVGYINDVWSFSFESNSWNWLAGNTTFSTQLFFYGTNSYVLLTYGSYTTPQYPGSRNGACWVTDGKLGYLIGGLGISYLNQQNVWGYLNDVWSFDMDNRTWTWLSGSSLTRDTTVRYDGNYNVQGVEDPGTAPRRRGWHTCSVDRLNDALYMHGGRSYSGDVLSDTMKFNLKNNMWTYISGAYVSGDQGKLVVTNDFSVKNYPANRFGSAYDQDAAGNLFMFGGISLDSLNNVQYPQELWIFNVTDGGWSRVFSGENGALANYVQKELHCSSASPGDRDSSQIYVNDEGSSLFLSGGYDVNVWWDYSDLWHFSKIKEETVCATETIAPTPTPAAPIATRRPRNDDFSSGPKLSGGAIAAIVIVILLVVLAAWFGGWFLVKKIRASFGDRAVPQETTPTGQGQAATTYEYPNQKLEFATIEDEGEPSASGTFVVTTSKA
eukprot:TRINITY_DN8145_c0_g1_i1.p1 TRINITY_DN8145_c0_g1~~TRINITY_DN8145_c0_g1_i1.p1  ORF type:complete len:608 (-),score=118.25 TRINITY_DN8145_c0_g1_i1:39-1862(-)